MSKRWLPILLALLAVTTWAERPLNILVLYADDWRHDTLGAAGNSTVHTPHLDRLAARGVRFANAAVTTSLCGPSRASLLTGQWMSRHGNHGFAAFDTPWDETFPGRLRREGYTVAHAGKWHCGAFPAEAFDFGRAYHGRHWMAEPGKPRVHVTRRNENDAIEFLRSRDPVQPFCLTVAFFAPHAEDGHPLQYLPQPGSLELYSDGPVPVPGNATQASLQRLPDFLASDKTESRRRWGWRFDAPGKYQFMMKNYFRLVSEVDAACGEIVAELGRQDLEDSTLIIFTGDNGYFHGEHGLADKWYPFEPSIRVPLIVCDPRGKAAAGTTRNEWALNVDLAPTILAAAGVPAPPGMQGRDLGPLCRGEAPDDWRTEFFYEHPTLRSVDFIPSSEALVGHQWKYVRWPDFGREQLFDLVADPYEERDLAGDPAQAERLHELRQRCDELKQTCL